MRVRSCLFVANAWVAVVTQHLSAMGNSAAAAELTEQPASLLPTFDRQTFGVIGNTVLFSPSLIKTSYETTS